LITLSGFAVNGRLTLRLNNLALMARFTKKALGAFFKKQILLLLVGRGMLLRVN
jgi:hypothetical protein